MAILWHEMWHEGLEEASRLYFGERNVKGMFAVLEPLHAMMERGPQTLKETSFNQVCVNSDALVIYICPQVVADVFRGGNLHTFMWMHSCYYSFGRAFCYKLLKKFTSHNRLTAGI